MLRENSLNGEKKRKQKAERKVVVKEKVYKKSVETKQNEKTRGKTVVR